MTIVIRNSPVHIYIDPVPSIPRTTESDPNFFRIPTPEYGYGKSTGTGENSKEVTEYGTNSEVFENAKYGYGTMTEFF